MLTYFTFFLVVISPVEAFACPKYSKLAVSSTRVLSTDKFQSLDDVTGSDVCTVHFYSSHGHGLVVSISNLFLFSYRQPINSREITIHDGNRSYIVSDEPKAYRHFINPIAIDIPANLNVRSTILISAVVPCTNDTVACKNVSAMGQPIICVPRSLHCDGLDSCGEDVDCRQADTMSIRPLSSYVYDEDSPSSSQLMLIGFFVLNGSFIVFFLALSVCSAGICYSPAVYRMQNQRSRKTFLRYIRDASHINGKTSEDEPPVFRRPMPERTQRPSILSRINFDPAPTLRELEPELEDIVTTPLDDICEPPKHRPDIFLRRQSLPVIQASEVPNPAKEAPRWKRSSLGGRH